MPLDPNTRAPAPAPPVRSLTLPSGRRLAWAELGPVDARPVLVCHGVPGSRLQTDVPAELLERLGLRLATPDRPGMGGSDFQPGRRLLDWPADAAALADRLGWGRFAVLGVSGGAPYACACALALPERIESLTLVSPLAPLAGTPFHKEMHWRARAFLSLARLAPGLARPGVWLARAAILRMTPRTCRPFMMDSGPDRAAFADEAAIARRLADIQEAFRGEARGPVRDALLAGVPWGFDPAGIRTPTRLWYGLEDPITPPDHARYYERTIPGCRAVAFPQAGHFMVFDRLEEILAPLAEENSVVGGV